MRRGLQSKIILTMVAVGLLPLAVGLLWLGLYGKSTLIEASGGKFAELAKQTAHHFRFIVEREIHEAQSLVLSEELRRAVSVDASAKPHLKSIVDHPASRYLQAYRDLKEDEYDIIFATDGEGRVAASTRPPPRLDYSDEGWWRTAYDSGRGRLFLSRLYPGPDSEQLRMNLSLPIMDQERERAIGVLTFIIRDEDLREILDEVRIGMTGHAMLHDREGRVLICSMHPAGSHEPIRVADTESPMGGWSMQADGHGGPPSLVGISPVSLGSEVEPDSSKQMPWWISVSQRRAELFEPIQKALWIMAGLGSLMAIFLVALGIFAGRRLVRPILALQHGATQLAQGNLSHRLRIDTRDELEAVSDTINQMAASLQQRASDLQQARDHLDNIIEQSAAFIITTDADSQIKEFNRSARETLGYRRQAIEGKPLEILWENTEEFRQVISQIRAKKQRIQYETVFAREDGTPIPVSCSLTEYMDVDGKVLGLILVGEDISDRKQLEASRLKAERLMALHRLTAVLTHDLRSPMVGILKALSLLQQSYGKMPEPQAQHLVTDLVRGGNMVLGTFNDLLDVYRYSLSALPLRLSEFRLKEPIDEIVGLLSADLQARGIRLRLSLADPDLSIRADRRRIQRVLFNLLDNALKHSPSGGEIGLELSAPSAEWIEIRVSDEGSGIAQEDRSKIFDFMYNKPRGDSGFQEDSGIGVGLYFTRVTVEAHRGSIQAENRPGRGALFTIRLPVSPDSIRSDEHQA